MLASIQPRALVHHATGAATSRAKSRVSTTTTSSLSHRQRRNVGRRHNDNAVSLVVSRAISQQSPTSATDKSTPSLHDYDGDQYEETIHDQGFVPRLERAINHAVVESSVLIIDKLFEGRDYPRFYALETVARVPYFSFLSVLHLYETLGFWRRADYLKVHFAQTMNEFHHLLIMESLGGDRKFIDRFFAQHLALGYYGIACLMYMVSPRMAYNLSEQVEEHAYHTYDGFLTEQEATLKACPPPPIAVHYYTEGDLFLFDEFQTGSVGGVAPRRPKIENLYDVFVNVRNDEAEHMKTMQFCQLPGTILRAPSEVARAVPFDAAAASNNIVTSGNGGGGNNEGAAMVAVGPGLASMDRTCEGLLDCMFSQDGDDARQSRDQGDLGGGAKQ